jgi:hypothetical protein
MPRWSVTIEQHAKESGNILNTFTFQVEGNSKAEAEQAAIQQVNYWQTRYPIHVQEGVWTDYQIRIPKSRITWPLSSTRNIITAISQIE